MRSYDCYALKFSAFCKCVNMLRLAMCPGVVKSVTPGRGNNLRCYTAERNNTEWGRKGIRDACATLCIRGGHIAS